MRSLSPSRVIAYLGVLALLGACASSSKIPTPSPSTDFGCGPGVLNKGTLTATVDGTPFTSVCVTASFFSSVVTIRATSGSQTIGIGDTAGAPVTHDMTKTAADGLVTFANGQKWTADINTPNSSGTITFSKLDSTGAAGTFTFIAVATAGTGASGTKTVTVGVFSVAF